MLKRITASPSAPVAAHALLELQRRYGNRYVQRMLTAARVPTSTHTAPTPAPLHIQVRAEVGLPPQPLPAATSQAGRFSPAQAAIPSSPTAAISAGTQATVAEFSPGQKPANTAEPPGAVKPLPPTAKTSPGEAVAPEEGVKLEGGETAVAAETAVTPAVPGAPEALPSTGEQVAAPQVEGKAGEKVAVTPAPEEAKAETEGAEEAAAVPSPESDARFQGVMQRLEKTVRQQKTHAPAAKKVLEARAAAVPPANDQSSQAQANQVEVMDQQQPKKLEKDDFLSLLRAELARITPQNMEGMEKFKEEGKAGQLKASLTGQVNQQKDTAAAAIKGATETEPKPEGITPKEVTPLPEEAADQPSPAVQTEEVLPPPKAEAEVSVEQNKEKAEQVMAENDLDEEQLKKANEPQFNEALEARQSLEKHAEQVPEVYRAEEQAYLEGAKAKATAEEEAAQGEMQSKRQKVKKNVQGGQQAAKKKEEEERKKVADNIQGMYQETRKKVEDKLNAMDGDVNRLFDDGEKRARDRFETDVDRRMAQYKWERYTNRLGGGLLWLKDKLLGMPDEVNQFYEDGRKQYIKDMDNVLVGIAHTVETCLKEAKNEIANGKEKIRLYVKGLPKELQKAGMEAQQEVTSKFNELEEGVDAKKKDLAQKMAQHYQESRNKLDKRIQELHAENQGLLSGFIEKIKGIIKILKDFKERVMSLLRESGDVIGRIVKDPIGFLEKLLAAIKQGFSQFSSNILTHLKKGLLGWLFGTLAEAGIEIPSELSFKAVFGVILQIIGITKESIRAKVTKLIGSKNVAWIEKAWSVVSTFISEGVSGLWEKAKQYLGDLKEIVLGGIQDWVITEIVKHAVLWLISLFNPVSALIKAIQLIYNVIMFFVENIERILQLVEAVIQSAVKIVAGQIGAAANWIENAMSRTVPIIIAFLARLLELSGISEKIKSIIKKVQKPVDKAITKVLSRIVGALKKVAGKVKGLAGKAKAKIKGMFGGKEKKETKEGKNEQDKEKRKKDQVLEFDAEAKLAMSGKGHKLMESFHKGKLILSIASNPEELKGALMEAIKEVNKYPGRSKEENKKKAIYLDTLIRWQITVTDIYETVNAEKARILKGVRYDKEIEMRALEQETKRQLAKLANQIEILAKDAGIESLHKFFKKPPKERYIPFRRLGYIRAGDYIRKKLYDILGWEGVQKNVRNEEYTPLIEKVKKVQQEGDPDKWKSLIEEGLVEDKPDRVHYDPKKVKYEVDHKEALACRWTKKEKGGYNLTDDKRKEQMSERGNLRLVTEQYNREKGSGGCLYDVEYVGPGFTSDIADGGINGALKIDNVPFEDANGKPLTEEKP